MEISYDPRKDARNVAVRGLSFDLVKLMDFDAALVKVDDRNDYGEIRYIALSTIRGRVFVVVFTTTTVGLRVISFRKVNAREVKAYETWRPPTYHA